MAQVSVIRRWHLREGMSIREIARRTGLSMNMVGHYQYEPEFCNPAAGWEKGQVEKAVLDARHGLWYDTPPFKSLQELNNWLQERCRVLWQETAHP